MKVEDRTGCGVMRVAVGVKHELVSECAKRKEEGGTIRVTRPSELHVLRHTLLSFSSASWLLECIYNVASVQGIIKCQIISRLDAHESGAPKVCRYTALPNQHGPDP